eukprot:6173758-Pleurochrysis_carterae.AAC.2
MQKATRYRALGGGRGNRDRTERGGAKKSELQPQGCRMLSLGERRGAATELRRKRDRGVYCVFGRIE